MIYSQTINLNVDTLDVYVNNYSPLELTISIFDLYVNKVRAIEFLWYDGTKDITLYRPSTAIDEYWDKEKEDFKLFVYKKVFTNTLTVSSFINKIKIYSFGSSEPIVFNLTVNLNYPNVDYYTTDIYNNPIFQQFHLIKTKMFGPENEILYTFEANGYDRPYILNSLVNWKIKPKEKVSVEKLNKIFNISEPYSINFSNNPSISAIPHSTSANNDVDSAIYQIYP